MQHPWECDRPFSSWIPGGLSAKREARISRKHIPVLDTSLCSRCGLCWIYCPDGCIKRGEAYVINHKYCKGCGVCARECPKKAIAMVKEVRP